MIEITSLDCLVFIKASSYVGNLAQVKLKVCMTTLKRHKVTTKYRKFTCGSHK